MVCKADSALLCFTVGSKKLALGLAPVISECSISNGRSSYESIVAEENLSRSGSEEDPVTAASEEQDTFDP
eukprot:6461380-Amphidinium_carterae.2